MERYFLVVFLVVMLASGLTACSAGEADIQPSPPASQSMPTLTVPPASFVPTRPDEPVQKPETFRITEYIPLGGTEEIPEPVKGPWQSDETFEPEDFSGYFVVAPEKKQIGGELEVERVFESPQLYTKIQAAYSDRGVFNIGTDPVMYRQGSHYDGYALKNGAYERLEEHSFVGDYIVLGESVHLEFDWVEYEGEYIATYAPAETYHVWGQSFPDGSVFLSLDLGYRTGEDGKTYHTWYPVVLNLKTGELTELLAGTEGEKLFRYRDGRLNGDRSGMLLSEYRLEGGSYPIDKFYYLDLTSGKLWPLEELSGEAANGYALLEDRLACWVFGEKGHRVWSIDLTTMERSEILSEERYLHGLRSDAACANKVAGSRFGLWVNEQRNVVAIDLYSGERWLVPGLEWSTQLGNDMQLSPDGSKMLFYRTKEAENPVIEYLAVLDMERHVFFELDRENEYCSGESTRWRTGDSFAVGGSLRDGSGSYSHTYTLTG